MHLIKHVHFGHGNAHAAVDLACAQAARGDEVIVVSGGGAFEPLLARNGVSHLSVSQETTAMQLVRAAIRINRIVRDTRPDVIHAHMVTSALLGRLPAWLHGRPLIATSHNTFDRQSRLLRWSDVVIGVSAASARQIAAQSPKATVRVVLNGTLGAPRRAFFGVEHYDIHSPGIGTLCGLHPRKGIGDLIAAFERIAARFPQSRLYIAGDGPMRADYEALAQASAAHAQIRFLGEMRDSRQFLEALDIFVLASHAEPFGLVLTEAREGGCAIVASDVDGIPDALDGGRAGILVPPRCPAALGDAMAELLGDPDKLKAMKHNALTGIEAFDVARVARDHDMIYREAISRRGAVRRSAPSGEVSG